MERTNERQKKLLVHKALKHFGSLDGRTFAAWGLAFKPKTDDMREAPSVDIVRALVERGARVRAYDPVAMERFTKEHPDLELKLCASPEEVAVGADALVLITEWQEYGALNWEHMAGSMRSPILLDGRQVLDRQRMTAAGFRCFGLAG